MTKVAALMLVALCWGCSDDNNVGGASSSSPKDGSKNADETDIDCGGQQTGAVRCADGRKCVDASDCVSLFCNTEKVCAPPTPSDSVKNGDETGVDCGGPESNPRCPAGQTCLASTDCDSKVCDPGTHTCNAPTSSDGEANGDESDIDCGGTITAAQRCAVGKTCNVHADCASDGCGYEKKCVENKTCAQHHGGDTCGPLDAPESCCTPLDVPLPGAPFKLDKYMITAGRFRQFVERTNGDIRGYIKTNRPAWWEEVWDAYVPNVIDDGSYVSHDGVVQELGPGLFSPETGGNQGCENEAYGARTYFIPEARSRELWNDAQHYPQDDLDEKALTCTTFFMYAAFCAWDGGRLPTAAELDFAYTSGDPNPAATHLYPWGQNPVPGGWNLSFSNMVEAVDSGTLTPAAGDQTLSAYLFNWWSPANRVCGERDGAEWCDFAVHVAPPGRFPAGNGAFGHSDLAGLLLHMTANISGSVGESPESRNVAWGRNGSWEGHGIPFYNFGDTIPLFRSTSKYRSAGARCAY